jgi:two-component system, NarL family, response regulator DevR
MNPSEKLRVLIVDDHRVVRAGVRCMLNEEPALQVVGEAGSAEEVLPLVQKTKPNLVLLDMRLPDQSGAEVCRRIKQFNPSIKVVILTSFAEARLVFAALAAGADGYLLKDCRDDVLVQSLKTIGKGSQVLAPAVLNIVTGSHAKESRSDPLEHFTPREMSILRHLADGCTYREISDRLAIAEKTVRNAVSQMMGKADARTRNKLIALYVSSARDGSI